MKELLEELRQELEIMEEEGRERLSDRERDYLDGQIDYCESVIEKVKLKLDID